MLLGPAALLCFGFTPSPRVPPTTAPHRRLASVAMVQEVVVGMAAPDGAPLPPLPAPAPDATSPEAV